MSKPVVFPLFMDRWVGSTRHLSSSARTIYLELLLWSWGRSKPVPLSPATRAHICSVSVLELRSAWKELKEYWRETPGGFVNDSLERKRKESRDFYTSQAEKSAKGVAARQAKRATPGATPGSTPGQPQTLPSDLDLRSRSSDLDLRSPDLDLGLIEDRDLVSRDPQESADRARAHATPSALATTNGYHGNPHHNPANLINGADQRRHGQHGVCFMDRGLCMPRALHDELLGRIGGDVGTRRPRLKAWADGRVAKLGESVVGEDVWTFWKNAFAEDFAPATSKSNNETTKTGGTMAAARRVMQKRIEQHAAKQGDATTMTEAKRAAALLRP